MIAEFALQTLLVTVLLTLLGGVSQALPWGIGSAQVLRQSSSPRAEYGTRPDRVRDLHDSPVVTPEFDRVMISRVNTLTTDRSFSWIVSAPISSYNPRRYLAIEVVTQLLVAVGLVALNALLADTAAATRVVVALIAASLTATAAYGQLANWWGLTLRYAIGVSATLIVGWTLSIWLLTLIWG